jgi:hypothetical protein
MTAARQALLREIEASGASALRDHITASTDALTAGLKF